ncbi:MAG: ATP-binding protein [Kovacikia sp.]
MEPSWELLANVSHELRTPLNGMIGSLRLLLDGVVDDPEEQQEFLQETYHLALHLLDISNEILEIARIESGHVNIAPQPIELDKLLDSARGYAHPLVHQRNLDFKIQPSLTQDEVILFGDYQCLKQVLFNLIGNAIKFTQEGGITIAVEVVQEEIAFQDQRFPGMVQIRIIDTGIGVAPDQQERLFQAFTQITRVYGGTGLGLVISAKLIAAMGGTISFYSQGEGYGSTVTFTVPLYSLVPAT